MPILYPQCYCAMLVIIVTVQRHSRLSSPLEACLALPGVMKASFQGGGLQVWSRSGPLGPLSDLYIVFSSGNLISTSGGGGDKGNSNNVNALGISWKN